MTDDELRYYSHPKMQEKFRERIEEIVEGDLYLYCINDEIRHFDNYFDLDEDGRIYDNVRLSIRLPLPIDPVNPERGLWGMVDWNRWFPTVLSDGRLMLHDQRNFDSRVAGSTPVLALLKALAHQWNVEVPK